MRSISKLFSAALMLILAAACNTKEIDNPDNPDKPKVYDNIILTAGINQTRVDYKVDNGKLVPGWVEGDVIFGYYGSGDGSQIEFTVEDLNDDGTAVLEPGKGWDDFLQQIKSLGDEETLPIGLIYTGSEASYSPKNPNDVIVSMTPPTGVNIPACMHASKYQVVKQDDTQIIRFLFDNDCAIFEIESLTGIAEEAALAEDEESLALTSLTITNLIPTYEYSYASGKLSGKSGTGDLESYTITLPENTWQVDYEGNINRTDAKNLLIAVAPNSEEDILITATTEGGRQFSYLYHGELVGGKCYIIRKRDVIAKTEDGQYFKTVYDAFEHAEYLNDYDLLQGRTNTVTLLVDEIYGLGDQDQDDPVYDTQIKIDYDVTLDLNGFGLSIDGFESFIVQETGDFTITDSRYDGEERVGIWSWTTEEDVPVIKNFGSTSITSAYVFSDNLIVDNEGGVLDVVDSDIQSFFDITINNTGEVKIFDSEITSGEVDYLKNEYYAGDYVINNEGKCSLEISNSKVSFFDGLYDGSQKTAVIYFKNSNTGENNLAYFKMDGGEVSGGTATTGDNVVYSYAEAIQLLGNVTATISGNAKVNSDSFNAVTLAPIYADGTEKVVSVPAGELTITGGTITSTDGNAIVNYGDLTISGGTITSEEGNAIVNDGELTITDGTITSEEGCAVTNNYGYMEVSGGYLYSSSSNECFTVENYSVLTVEDETIPSLKISGGKIESEYYSAIYNEEETSAQISGGTIEVHGNDAIDNYGELTIGEKNSTAPKSIMISSNSIYSNTPTIYCSVGGTLNVYYGTIKNTGGGGAIELNNKANGYVYGGVISNNSNYVETIRILNGAECTISGGVIYSEGDIPTIACRSTGKGEDASESSTLTVKWPGSAPSNPALETGPIIYAKGASNPNAAPISVEYPSSDVNSNAVVKINGGYLISSNGVFFVNNEPGDLSYNLDLSNFGNFYSNAYKIRKDGDALGDSADLFYDLSPDNGYALATGYKFRATKYKDYDEDTPSTLFGGFDMPAEIGGSTGDLYKIIVCNS